MFSAEVTSTAVLIAIVRYCGPDSSGVALSSDCAAQVANLVAMTRIGMSKDATYFSPPFLSTLVARAFAVRATGLAADLHSLLPEYEAALRECRGINCEPSKSRLTTPLLACS